MASNSSHSSKPVEPDEYGHIWVIYGPAGCGKSTVGKHIASELGLPFIEGDEFHPPTNVKKMSEGHPLDDNDRWEWLNHLRQECIRQLKSHHNVGVVLACSALKKRYRDILRHASDADAHIHVHFVFLSASKEVLLQRVKARQNHFMKDSMIESQFADLESPQGEELQDCLQVDVSGTANHSMDTALDVVKRALASVVANEVKQ